MANRNKGEVDFEADGTPYTLCFSINALCELEDKLGESVADLGATMTGRKRFSTLRTVFWCGLSDHHEGLSEKDAGRIMSDIGVAKADALVGEAFRLAFPEVPEVPLDKPAKAERARTGSSS